MSGTPTRRATRRDRTACSLLASLWRVAEAVYRPLTLVLSMSLMFRGAEAQINFGNNNLGFGQNNLAFGNNNLGFGQNNLAFGNDNLRLRNPMEDIRNNLGNTGNKLGSIYTPPPPTGVSSVTTQDGHRVFGTPIRDHTGREISNCVQVDSMTIACD